MNKQNSIFGLLFLLIFSSGCEHDICKLSGKVDNIANQTYIYLIDYDSYEPVDSILVENGEFSYQFNLEYPKQFILHNKRNQYRQRDRKTIWLEPSDISIKGDHNFMKNLVVSGSESHDEYSQYNLIVDSFSRQVSKSKENLIMDSLAIKASKVEGTNLPDDDKMHQLKKDSLKLLEKELTDRIFAFLNLKPNSYVSLSTLYNESYLSKRHLSKEQINTVYEKLSNKLKNNNKGVKIKKFIDLPNVPQIGDKAPDIIQATPDGDTIKLSDYKGRYVFVDFWASWCGPCRGDFEGLKEIYKKYHPQGLEIIGVSGDSKEKNWIAAITHDSLPWINISDLRGWENEAFLVYDIKKIPVRKDYFEQKKKRG